MARNEVFDGPISESIPSSVVSFSHRRNRNDSTVSFTYFQGEDDFVEWPDEHAVDAGSDLDEEAMIAQDTGSIDGSVRSSFKSRRPSYLRSAVEEPLLPQRRSSLESYGHDRKADSRLNQKVHIESEDLTIVIAGFSSTLTGLIIYFTLCVMTLGFAYLLFRWFPRWRVRLIGKPTPLRICQWVAIEDQWNQFNVYEVGSQQYGRPLSTVFADPESYFYDEDNDPTVSFLRYIDYRYLRFFYHPVEDKFCLISGWKDPLWTNAKVMRSGLDADDRDSREQIFGTNLIDIQQKSIFQLLMDEAFHPFYIFQLASLLLWSMDQYYYYAACIFIISVVSIGTTVLETKATMSRLREISLFECDIRVLRNGFWRSVPSQELVPGDVFEVSDPSLNQVPCDCILLSGDCIVNESMLTGESVPVSKAPLTDDALGYLNLSAPSVHPNIAKHFLFSGTKVIRARRPQNVDDDEAIALAIVVRTGFLTTKGALVRSMLFPKPSGFKFYRDSFRYISVMAVIAILGFIASFVNFIRLGIFCISPQRVNVGGKLDVICFDKTGTLTEDGLDVLGVRTVDRNHSLSELQSDLTLRSSPSSDSATVHDISKQNKMIYAMATPIELGILRSFEFVSQLRRASVVAGIRNIMCTGDNILTAVSVARECGLLSKDEQCFVPHFVQGHHLDPEASLCWESIDDPTLKLDAKTLMPAVTSQGPDLSIPATACDAQKYSLAVSGDVFRWIVDFGSDITLKRMLVRGNVFARMSPDEKHELVERLQSLDYCCGFCGDGANDCGALKAADVGISLSDAEASVAAPFTSRQFDVSCVPTLI
ncbi:hypothetical protein ATERTT37_001164, partial [Aspergillus terreus]